MNKMMKAEATCYPCAGFTIHYQAEIKEKAPELEALVLIEGEFTMPWSKRKEFDRELAKLVAKYRI